jgi:hypothetical protein
VAIQAIDRPIGAKISVKHWRCWPFFATFGDQVGLQLTGPLFGSLA